MCRRCASTKVVPQCNQRGTNPSSPLPPSTSLGYKSSVAVAAAAAVDDDDDDDDSDDSFSLSKTKLILRIWSENVREWNNCHL